MVNTSIVVASGTIGTRAVSSKYPVTEGITAGTTKENSDGQSLKPEINLTPEDLR